MHWFFLAALALAAAAALWSMLTAPGSRDAAAQPPAAGAGEAFRPWLDRPGVQEILEQAVEVLLELMAHPKLGGPGFLTLRLPQPGEAGSVTVSAQYPNIREAMYGLIIRRKLDRETLLRAGLPERLTALSPVFETESGGVVVVSIPAGSMDQEVVGCISGRGERQAALRLLAGCLEQRFPDLEVRPFGSELLLTPVRVGTAV